MLVGCASRTPVDITLFGSSLLTAMSHIRVIYSDSNCDLGFIPPGGTRCSSADIYGAKRLKRELYILSHFGLSSRCSTPNGIMTTTCHTAPMRLPTVPQHHPTILPEQRSTLKLVGIG